MSVMALNRPSILGPTVPGVVLLLVGIFGGLNAAWGYGLFLVSGLLLLASLLFFCVFVFSRRFDSNSLKWSFTWLFILGAWCYVYSICALGGYFIYETLQGRMEFKWILFGPVALAALVILDVGIYRIVVGKNLPTYQRYRQFVSREQSDPTAMRRTLVDDVIVQKALLSVSGVRWLRHTLIFWGFILMFLTEMLAVFFREAVPAFGFADIWEMPGHSLRLAFNFAFDFFGLMVLIGSVMALVWRAAVNGTEEQKYSDTPTVLFLFFVVLSGFLVEAIRIAASPYDPSVNSEFVGYAMALVLPSSQTFFAATYEPLWLIHVLGSCLFIAYVPVKRLIHSCATPMGRLMNSQKALLAAKKHGVISGLMTRRS
ncbi:MAG: respiratory nitrate reductase subunit gamma [Acidiferrobacterales bacterium]